MNKEFQDYILSRLQAYVNEHPKSYAKYEYDPSDETYYAKLYMPRGCKKTEDFKEWECKFMFDVLANFFDEFFDYILDGSRRWKNPTLITAAA